MFTNSGMMQFVPYFLGEEPVPYQPPRSCSIQKCVRLAGKHNDIDELGRTRRHLTFFEMLGNWSFGDYFKVDAIKWAWELVTEVAGFDGDRLWVTVHITDDEAEQIWRDEIGLPDRTHPAARQGQLLGDGRDRAVRPVLRDPLRHAGPSGVRRAVPRSAPKTATSSSGTSCSCSTSVTATERSPTFPARNIDTGAGLRALAHAVAGRPHRVRHRHHAAAARHRPVVDRSHLRPRQRDRRARCASSPTTPAR